MSEICSKLSINTPERQWRRYDVSIVNFGQVNASWDTPLITDDVSQYPDFN